MTAATRSSTAITMAMIVPLPLPCSSSRSVPSAAPGGCAPSGSGPGAWVPEAARRAVRRCPGPALRRVPGWLRRPRWGAAQVGTTCRRSPATSRLPAVCHSSGPPMLRGPTVVNELVGTRRPPATPGGRAVPGCRLPSSGELRDRHRDGRRVAAAPRTAPADAGRRRPVPVRHLRRPDRRHQPARRRHRRRHAGSPPAGGSQPASEGVGGVPAGRRRRLRARRGLRHQVDLAVAGARGRQARGHHPTLGAEAADLDGARRPRTGPHPLARPRRAGSRCS